jgi:hypothetical protein
MCSATSYYASTNYYEGQGPKQPGSQGLCLTLDRYWIGIAAGLGHGWNASYLCGF